MNNTIDPKKKIILDSGASNTATKRALAYQIDQEIARQRISKARMAEMMGTSRAALNRLLDPENESITLQTMIKAADVLGKKITILMED